MTATNIATALAEKLVDVDVTLVFYYLSLGFLSIIVTIPFREKHFIFSNVTWLSLTFLDGAILWSWGEREPRGSSMRGPLIVLGVLVLLTWFVFSLIVLIQTADGNQVAVGREEKNKKEEQQRHSIDPQSLQVSTPKDRDD